MGGFRSVLLVSCLTPLSSAAAQFALGTAGILGGVAVSPQPISVGAPATILLSGAGECGQVTVNFGDGTSKTLTGVKFASNAQTQHTYSRSGNLTITALAGSNCNAMGEVKTSVIVEGSYADILCALTGCDDRLRSETRCLAPTIKSVSYSWPLEPKEDITIHGCGFGDAPTTGRGAVRKVSLKGSFPSPGAVVALQVLSWSTAMVTARVPALTGARDHTAKLQLVRDAALSNEVAVSFRATRELLWLSKQQHAQVLWAYCSKATPYNDCYPAYDGTYAGHHVNRSWTTEKALPAKDADWVLISLGNGWTLNKFQTSYTATPTFPEQYSGLDFQMPVLDATGFTPGAPSGALRFAWSLDPYDWTFFSGSVQVKGPVGVPLK